MNRLSKAAIALACALGTGATAPPQRAVTEPVLNLEDALALATVDQPRMAAYERDAQASEQAAVAARTLPDPKITAGILNFPITGSNALSPTDAMMTMYMVGIMREQVRSSKRQADAERVLAEAQLSRRQANAEERSIRREIMIAWIDAVEGRAKQRLLEMLIADLHTGHKVLEAGIPTGSSTPALALEMDAEIGVDESKLADAHRAESHARAELARWIGSSAASRPLPDSLPRIEVSTRDVPPIDAHPDIQVATARQQVARTEVDVARQDRKPDLSWSVSLGVRPKYGEMVTATVSVPLQINRRQRQDQLTAAAQGRADAAQLRVEDARRELEEKYQTAVADYQGTDAEVARIEHDAMPDLELAFKLAEARYEGGGGGTLDQPFDIVRRYVDVTLQSVEARARRARAAAEILYVGGEMHR